MNDPKGPQFLTDLVQDLRDRRLLLLIAVVAVAIVAVPFTLARDNSETATSAGGTPTASISQAGSASRLAVVTDNPGLRDYRRRLANLTAKDPFKPRVGGAGAGASSSTLGAAPTTVVPTQSPSAAGGGSSSSGSSLGVSSTSTTTTSGGSSTTDTTTTTTTDQGTGGGSQVVHQTMYLSYEIDVRVAHNGHRQTRRDLPALTPLPGKHSPAALFMGASPDGKQALLLVSDDVRSILGDAECGLGSQACQLLMVRPGLPETFVVGEQERRFRINVLNIHPVLSKRP